MPTEREKLEQELLEQAQKAIKKMLDELPKATDITLSDMEEATGVMGRSIMNQSLQKLAQEKQVVPTKGVKCKTCGEKMYRRGKRKKRVETVRGEIEIERQYLVCSKCGETYFPPR
jgi:YgiT-type zinc finger domain-containing protein